MEKWHVAPGIPVCVFAHTSYGEVRSSTQHLGTGQHRTRKTFDPVRIHTYICSYIQAHPNYVHACAGVCEDGLQPIRGRCLNPEDTACGFEGEPCCNQFTQCVDGRTESGPSLYCNSDSNTCMQCGVDGAPVCSRLPLFGVPLKQLS